MLGAYLFKYESETGSKPKGIPLPLATCEVTQGDEHNNSCIFKVSTLRKTYTIRASSPEEASEWVSAIKARKFDCIKEELGHASSSESTKSLNKAANGLYLEKLQIESAVASGEQQGVANPIYG